MSLEIEVEILAPTEITIDATTGNADVDVNVNAPAEITVDASMQAASEIAIATTNTLVVESDLVRDIDVDVTTAPDITIDTGYVGPQGPQGETGPPGPPGPPGDGSGGGAYEHVQAVSEDTWIVVHNLGYNPAVTVVDSAGSTVFGAVEHTDITSVTIRFSGAMSGKAYCS